MLRLMVPDSSNWMTTRQKRTIFTFETVAALFVIMPAHYSYVEMCDLKQINFKMNPTGVPTLKNITYFLKT